MNNRIVLEQLNRDLSANRAKVEGWAQSKITAVDNLQKQHLVSVEDLKSEFTPLLLTADSMGRIMREVSIAADSVLPFVVDRIATIEVKKAQREEEVEQLKKSESRNGSLVHPCESAAPMVLYCFAQLS